MSEPLEAHNVTIQLSITQEDYARAKQMVGRAVDVHEEPYTDVIALLEDILIEGIDLWYDIYRPSRTIGPKGE